MARPKQNADQISSMQNRILDATISLLDEMEPEEISIRKIAERLEVSHMVIYTYFKDRDALVRALIQRLEGRIRQSFDNVISEVNDGNVKIRMRSALLEYINIAKARPKLFRLIWVMPVKHPLKSERHHHLMDEQVALLAKLFESGMQRGIFAQRDSQTAALTVLSIINAPLFLFNQGRMSDPKLRDQVINETLDIVMTYISPN